MPDRSNSHLLQQHQAWSILRTRQIYCMKEDSAWRAVHLCPGDLRMLVHETWFTKHHACKLVHGLVCMLPLSKHHAIIRMSAMIHQRTCQPAHSHKIVHAYWLQMHSHATLISSPLIDRTCEKKNGRRPYGLSLSAPALVSKGVLPPTHTTADCPRLRAIACSSCMH